MSVPVAFVLALNQEKYGGQSRQYLFSEASDTYFSWMMIASIKLMTRMMDGCLILNKLRRGRVSQRVMATLQC